MLLANSAEINVVPLSMALNTASSTSYLKTNCAEGLAEGAEVEDTPVFLDPQQRGTKSEVAA